MSRTQQRFVHPRDLTLREHHRRFVVDEIHEVHEEVAVHASACGVLRPPVGARVRLVVETTPRGLRAASCDVIDDGQAR
jgi:hypothetical protein